MMKQAENCINLEELAGGAFAEKVNEAIMQVAENIQNPNTDATARRKVKVVLTFAPSKTRQMVNTTIAVTTKLAPTEAIDTQMVVGTDLRTGKVEIAEYDGQIKGQRRLFDLKNGNQPNTVDTDATEIEEPVPSGKPIDLKNKFSKKGLSVDETTGEVTEAEEPASSKIIAINS